MSTNRGFELVLRTASQVCRGVSFVRTGDFVLTAMQCVFSWPGRVWSGGPTLSNSVLLSFHLARQIGQHGLYDYEAIYPSISIISLLCCNATSFAVKVAPLISFEDRDMGGAALSQSSRHSLHRMCAASRGLQRVTQISQHNTIQPG